jgi:predicted dehydrogenase
VLGAGNWGRNLVRTFAALPRVDLRLVVDVSSEARERAGAIAANIASAQDPEVALADPAIAAVAIATPAATHARLVTAALAAGKHVFVEKPLCLSVAEGAALREIAARAGRVLMVGHLLQYHPAIEKLKTLVHSGDLGVVRYLYSTRVNLGVVRHTESAWWSLAPHDISVILELIGAEPVRVTARGASYLASDVEDVVFAQLDFPGGVMASLHVSWLDPHKRRELTVVGSQKMASFDDMAPAEKLRIYDKGAEVRSEYQSFAEMVALRHGDILIPHIDAAEPLRVELSHFVDCALSGAAPRTGVEEGLRVVRVLEAGQRSLAQGGATIALDPR